MRRIGIGCRLALLAGVVAILAIAGPLRVTAQEASDAQAADGAPMQDGASSADTVAPQQTKPEQTRCPVPPVDAWTDGEKDAWAKICLGQFADLSVGDPFPNTGDVDKWQPRRTLGAAFLLRIMTDPVYVAATPFTGIRIDGAHFADAVVLSDLEYNKPLIIVDSVFSQPLVLERFRSRSRVRLTGDWFSYAAAPDAAKDAPLEISLDASAAEIAKGLDLNWIFVNGDIDLSDMKISTLLEMSDTTFLGTVYLNRTKIDGGAFLQRVKVSRNVYLDNAEVAQNLEIGDFNISRLLDNGDTEWGTLSGAQLHVSGHLIIGYSDAEVRMPARLVGQAPPQPAPEPAPEPAGQGAAAGAAPDVAASLPDASQTEPQPATDLAAGTLANGNAPAAPERTFTMRAWRINLIGARIDGELRIRGTWLLDQVTLEDAVIGDDLWLSDSDISRGSFSATSVKGFALLQGIQAHGNIQFDNASIGRSIVFDDLARVTGLRMPGAVVHGGIYFAGATIDGPVDLNSVTIDRDLAMGDGTTFTGPVDASFARVGGSVDLTGGRFASVDLTGADIAAELRLAAAGAVPLFAEKAELTLRNVTTNSLQDVAESWPCILHLEGFVYQRQVRSDMRVPAGPFVDRCRKGDSKAGDTQAAATAPAGAAKPSAAESEDAAAERRTQELITWLGRQVPFSPQPYVQLSGVLRQTGDYETAKAILFAGKEREFDEAGWPAKIWLAMQWAFTGYGQYPQVAGLWVIGLIVLGAVVFTTEPSPEMRRLNWLQRGVYSFDMLMPAVHLRHHHAEIEAQAWWVRTYVFCHKLMGYVLLSFLAAAVLGLGGLE